jgi:D-alanine-D-alanine ligase
MVARRRTEDKVKLLVLYNRPGRARSAPESEPSEETRPDRAEIEVDHLRALASGLAERGFEVALVDAEDDTQRITHALVVEQPALVFLVDHFDGEALRHPSVASLLDLHRLPYTGSDPLCLSTCRDRVRTHLLLSDAEIPVPGYVVVRDINAIPDTAGLAPPLLVSHALAGPQRSAAVAGSRQEVEERARDLAAESGLPLLIERFIEGRRIHAVVLGNRVLEVLPLSERADGSAAIAQLDMDTADAIRALAQRAFRVMGCRDCAEVEFALDRDGRPHVVDVHPVFDMYPEGPFVVGASASELGVAGAVAHLAEIALERAEPEAPIPLAELIPGIVDAETHVEEAPGQGAPLDAPASETPSGAGRTAASDASAPEAPAARPRPQTPRRRPASRSRPRSAPPVAAPANRSRQKAEPRQKAERQKTEKRAKAEKRAKTEKRTKTGTKAAGQPRKDKPREKPGSKSRSKK